MAFAGLSTVLVYKKEKCLVKSGKDSRTTKGAVDVRSKGLWTYVLRVLGRTSIEPLNELEWE